MLLLCLGSQATYPWLPVLRCDGPGLLLPSCNVRSFPVTQSQEVCSSLYPW